MRKTENFSARLDPSAPVRVVRTRAAQTLRSRVAGGDADRKAQRIWGAPGERWFTPQDPIGRVHADASMFPGGIRALLFQSLHPVALAGVEDHSRYRDDPWKRVQNTSDFIATTTFGRISDAEAMIGAIRRIHETVVGTGPDRRPYRASDPHLLQWVHIAEIDSFLTCYQRYAATPLTPAEADTYVAQTAVAAELLGVQNAPRSTADLDALLTAYRAELQGTPAARRVARFLLLDPPLPLIARPAYAALASGAVGTLPSWALGMLGLPAAPLLRQVGPLAGKASTATVRWVMSDPSIAHPAPEGTLAAG